MNTSVRLLLVLALLTGIAISAGEKTAGADRLPGLSLSAVDRQGRAFPDRKDDDCIKGRGKDKDKCKEKGTVKPPAREIVITRSGKYSVAGFCMLSIELIDPNITLHARITTPLPGVLPKGVHRIRQGCLLTYYSSNRRIDALSPSSGNTTICFAATPKKEMTIYFYDIYAPNPAWVPVQTTLQDGTACAPGTGSGVYIGTFRHP